MTTPSEKYNIDVIKNAGLVGEWAENQILEGGKDYLPVSRKIYGRAEIENAVEAVLDGWWTEGRWTKEFEAALKGFLVTPKDVVMVNSGSSANLLALAALKEKYNLPDGSEIITSALAFPTTINPILQLGFKPYFVDVRLGTYVPSLGDIMAAISKNTAAIMMAHTLGNPWPADYFSNEFPVIEDNCDALGSMFHAEHHKYHAGTIGDFGTLSFYPAHHITTGEGGAVICSSSKAAKIVRSLRDWGRDCWCGTGKSDTCGQRFDKHFEGLPPGYDHKYVYSRIGWNMKSTDINAAIGVAQMERLPAFIEKRQQNFDLLRSYIIDSGLGECYILPEASKNTSPSWFGFPLTIQMSMPFGATEITRVLEDKYRIGTRRIFGGNILRQPAYRDVEYESADLKNTNIITHNSFWLGIWPGLSSDNIRYIAISLFEATKILNGGRL